MKSITFVVDGVPIAQGSKHASIGHRRDGTQFVNMREGADHAASERHAAWRQLVTLQARSAARRARWVPVDEAVQAVYEFVLPTPKKGRVPGSRHVIAPDLDKLVRAVGDSLTDLLFRDDSRISDLHALKRYARTGERPHCKVTVRTFDE